MSCNSTPTDLQKNGLKDIVLCVYQEKSSGNYITEYNTDGMIIREIYFVSVFNKGMFTEKNYNYSNRKIGSIDVVKLNLQGKLEKSKEYSVEKKEEGNMDFKYKYDDKGNWIERSFVNNGENIIENRKVFYLEDDYQPLISQYESFKSSLLSNQSDNNDNSVYHVNSGSEQVQSNSINNTQNQSMCSYCKGTGRCPTCNKVFRVHYWKNGYGYKDENETRPGKVMCETCNGSGKIYGTMDLMKKEPRYKPCYISNCNGGWLNCPECNHDGNGEHLGECKHCKGTGYKI